MATRVLMIGTALCGKGGIAAAVAGLDHDGLFEREGVRYLATHAEGSRAHKLGVALGGSWRTALACLVERPAVVHAHAASHASFYRKSVLLLLARRCGARTVFHLHGGGFRQFATVESGPLARWWIRHTLEASSIVIALSGNWATFLAGYAPAARVRVVPNSVDVARLASACTEEAGRILFLGRACGAKGVYDLLAAVAALAPAFPGVRLAVGGDGDLALLRTRAAQLGISGRVEVLGWLGAQEKADQLARACVFCLPSHAEGMPLAMLEAMAAGKAAVVSRVGAMPEVVADGENGLLVPPRDVAALAAALSRLLSNDALRHRIGARARATVAQRYSAAVVAARLADVYRELDPGAPR
jgi:glycosyltransferase involved in cell wall biosynthesis